MKQSSKFSLNVNDIKASLKNLLVFAGPDLVLFLGAISLKLQAEQAFLAVLVLNLAIDLLKKFLAGK